VSRLIARYNFPIPALIIELRHSRYCKLLQTVFILVISRIET
jgi:hypothetical protein